VDLVLTGLQVLGIQLPGFDFVHAVSVSKSAAGTPLDCTMPRVRLEESNNNNIPRPFSNPQLPEASMSLQTSIVRLPDSNPMLSPLITSQPRLGFKEMEIQLGSQLLSLAPGELVQCNVVGCRGQVSLQGLSEHFKDHQVGFNAFMCEVCNFGFKSKKSLEIHRMKNHVNVNLTSLAELEEVGRIDEPLIKVEPSLSSENVQDTTALSTRKRKRSKNESYVEDNLELENEVSDSVLENEAVDDPDCLIKETQPVVKDSLICALCQAVLQSEWHRHPRRHTCPHATPKSTLKRLSGNESSHCSLCNTPVLSSWYKPPSRHNCTGLKFATRSPLRDCDLQSTAIGGQKRTRLMSTPGVKRATTSSNLELSDDGVEKPAVYSCPRVNCSRQCTNKRSLLVHLAMVHYKEELEDLIVNECDTNKCPECNMPLPNNKMGNIMHMALVHEIVMKFARRDTDLEVSVGPVSES